MTTLNIEANVIKETKNYRKVELTQNGEFKTSFPQCFYIDKHKPAPEQIVITIKNAESYQ